MANFRCDWCEQNIDKHDSIIVNYRNKEVCEPCFLEEFECQDCYGIQGKEQAAAIKVFECECDGSRCLEL